jgi:hypothetical protein
VKKEHEAGKKIAEGRASSLTLFVRHCSGNEITERWVERVVCVREKRNAWKILMGYLKGRNHFEDLGADGRKILN